MLEDALITWRYAEHLARGAGFTFNMGERVLGTTTPFLAVVLAGFSLITGTALLPVVAVALMIVCGAATGWLVYHALRASGFSHAVSIIAIAVLMLHADIVWSTVGGMETPLLLMLMALSLFGAITERYYVAMLACAALPFVRPDAVIWAMLVVIPAVVSGKGRIVKPALAATILAGAGAMALTLYFGSPVPHSIVAKRTIGPGGGAISWYSIEQWFRWVAGASAVNAFGGRIERVAIWPWLGFVSIGGFLVMRRASSRQLWPIVAFPPLLATAYLVSNAPHFLWYLVPLTACLCILGAIGIGHVWEARWPAAPSGMRVVMVAATFVVLASFVHQMRSTADWHWRNQRDEWQVREAVGEWLNANTPPESSVLMEAIGYQGTLSGRKVIDLAGLISPRVVELQRQSHSNAEAFARIVSEFAPDYIVLRTIEVNNNQHFYGGPLFESADAAAAFHAAYHPVAEYRAPYPEIWLTASSVTIYARD